MPENVSRNPEEYELVSRNELERLQHEVDKIKKNPFGDTTSSKDLLGALDKLNKNVSTLVRIFETANDEIVRDYKDKANTEKINRVLEQNEKLARGIVAIADLLKEQRVAHGKPEEVAPDEYKERSPVSPVPSTMQPTMQPTVPGTTPSPVSHGVPTWQPGMPPPGPEGMQQQTPEMGLARPGVPGRPGPRVDLGDVPPPPR